MSIKYRIQNLLLLIYLLLILSYNQYQMHYSTIVKQLEASRRLNSQLSFERQQQQYERAKIEKQLQSLRRSRKNYIEGQIAQSKLEYEEKLKEDNQVSEEHMNRKKRVASQMAKIAQFDFEKQRERLIQERNNHDNLDKEYRIIDKALLDIQTRSRIAQQQQDRKLFELTSRKTTILKLLEDSKSRQLYHFEQSKRLSAF